MNTELNFRSPFNSYSTIARRYEFALEQRNIRSPLVPISKSIAHRSALSRRPPALRPATAHSILRSDFRSAHMLRSALHH